MDEEQQQRCLLLHFCVSLFFWSAVLVSFRLSIGLDLRRLPLTRAACCHRILLRCNCRVVNFRGDSSDVDAELELLGDRGRCALNRPERLGPRLMRNFGRWSVPSASPSSSGNGQPEMQYHVNTRQTAQYTHIARGVDGANKTKRELPRVVVDTHCPFLRLDSHIDRQDTS